MTDRQIIAMDFGGSHVTAGSFLWTGERYELKSSKRIFCDARLEKEELLAVWEAFINELKSNQGLIQLAIAFPAPFDYDNGICLIKEQDKFRDLFGVNLRKELSKRLGLLVHDILFMNDAQAFLTGECVFGKLNGFTKVLGLTLGTGLGSALKTDNMIVDSGLWSYPFKEGIAEDYLSAGWFIRWMAIEKQVHIKGVKELVEKEEYSESAKESFFIFANHLAEFIESIVFQYHPQIILLSGNICKANSYFLNDLRDILFYKKVPIAILLSDLREKAALLGAATLFSKDIIVEDLKKPLWQGA